VLPPPTYPERRQTLRQPPAVLPGRLPRTYLVAGTLEPFFLQNATRWADALRDAGADVVLNERVGSHGDAFWREEVGQVLPRFQEATRKFNEVAGQALWELVQVARDELAPSIQREAPSAVFRGGGHKGTRRTDAIRPKKPNGEGPAGS